MPKNKTMNKRKKKKKKTKEQKSQPTYGAGRPLLRKKKKTPKERGGGGSLDLRENLGGGQGKGGVSISGMQSNIFRNFLDRRRKNTNRIIIGKEQKEKGKEGGMNVSSIKTEGKKKDLR